MARVAEAIYWERVTLTWVAGCLSVAGVMAIGAGSVLLSQTVDATGQDRWLSDRIEQQQEPEGMASPPPSPRASAGAHHDELLCRSSK